MRAFVIATTDEAEAVRPAVGPGDLLLVCGVGKVNAAAAAQRAIDAGATEVLNAGLCGGFGDGVELGGVYEVADAVEYDFDLARLNGTARGVLNERTSPYIPLATVGRFAAKRLATGDRFTDDESDHSYLAVELKAELRDMEGGAIAHVCERAGVRCRALKCVSDVAGRGGMVGQYFDHRKECLECLRRAAISWT